MSEKADKSEGERKPLDPSQIRLPEGMSFSCHGSGRCCEDFWEIPLDETSLARLRALPLSSVSPKFLDPDSFAKVSPGPRGGHCLKRIGGRCVFLDPGRRCLIHLSFGAAAKPQTCLDFPYRYIGTPRGVFVGLSMACPSVRANRGQSVASQRDELAAAFAGARSVATIADPIELSPGLAISFEAYEQVESCLNDLLAFETLSLDDRLIAGYVLLQLLERAIVEMGDPAANASANAIRVTDAFANERYRRVLTIARKARGSARLHRALVGLLITYRSAFDARQRGRFSRSAYLLYQYVRHMGRFGTLSMPPIQGRLSLWRLRVVRADWSEPYFVHCLRRFCQHSLFRKDAILRTPLLKGYAFLLVFVALIRWYAAAYAASQGEREIGRSHMDEALGTVEKYYCFHTDFMRLFDQYAVLSGMVERLLAKPVFAPSILRPKGP
jgi:Fe-S-cluster containining protein